MAGTEARPTKMCHRRYAYCRTVPVGLIPRVPATVPEGFASSWSETDMPILRTRHILGVGILSAVLSVMAFSGSSTATGPRVTPRLLSPEKNQIFALDMPPFTSAEIPGGGLFSEIVLDALKSQDVDAVMETLPLTRLVRYYLFQDASFAVLAMQWSFSAEERREVIIVPFYVVRGGYFFRKPSREHLPRWIKMLHNLRGRTYGAKVNENAGEETQSGINVIYDRPVMLFRKLGSGSLDFVSVPDPVADWIIENQFHGEHPNLERTPEVAWEIPASIVFNKKHSDGEAAAKKFIRGLSLIIRNGRYREILEKYHGTGQVPPHYKKRLEHFWNKEKMTNTWSTSE